MIYLDNSATTTLCDGAKARMNEAMDCFGNPSSLHSVGYDASVLLGKARQTVLSSLGVRKNGDYEICAYENRKNEFYYSEYSEQRGVLNYTRKVINESHKHCDGGKICRKFQKSVIFLYSHHLNAVGFYRNIGAKCDKSNHKD